MNLFKPFAPVDLYSPPGADYEEPRATLPALRDISFAVIVWLVAISLWQAPAWSTLFLIVLILPLGALWIPVRMSGRVSRLAKAFAARAELATTPDGLALVIESQIRRPMVRSCLAEANVPIALMAILYFVSNGGYDRDTLLAYALIPTIFGSAGVAFAAVMFAEGARKAMRQPLSVSFLGDQLFWILLLLAPLLVAYESEGSAWTLVVACSILLVESLWLRRMWRAYVAALYITEPIAH